MLIKSECKVFGKALKSLKKFFVTFAINNYRGLLALGMNVWGDAKPNNIVSTAERLKEEYGDQVEFVRLDHFMALYSEKNRLPFNLGLSSGLTVSATSNADKADLTVDGTPAGQIWTASETGAQYY